MLLIDGERKSCRFEAEKRFMTSRNRKSLGLSGTVGTLERHKIPAATTKSRLN